MIPPERDDTMIVTMTKGELYALVNEAATQAATRAVDSVLAHMAASDSRQQDADMLCGGQAIAEAIGVGRNTMYRLMREGKLGDAVMHVGQKLFARRSELMKAIAANQ